MGLPSGKRDEHLLEPAWRLRTQSPELALAIGGHLVQQAGERLDDINRLRAQALLVIATSRVGRGFEVVANGIRALRSAEALRESECAHAVRIELAGCARALDLPQCGVRLLRPVLASASVAPATRAAVLTEAARCLGRSVWHEELDRALSAADRLYLDDNELDTNATGTSRAMLRAVAAVQHRRRNNAGAALGAAHEGMALLAELTDRDADGGQARSRLVLELVLAQLDRGSPEEAVEAAAEFVRMPVRATNASSVNWLRLALVGRVHLSAGRVERSRELLRLAADSAERHQLPSVLAESRAALAAVHEQAGETTEALRSLRSAQAARTAQQRLQSLAERLIGEEFPADEHESESLFTELTAYLARSGSATSGAKRDPFGLPRAGRRQLDVLSGEPVARYEPLQGSAPFSVRNGRRMSAEPDATDARPAFNSDWANGGDEDPVTERVSRRARRAATEEPNDAGTGIRSRYREDGVAGLPNVAGLVVTEGSGGRRRAPEPRDDAGNGGETPSTYSPGRPSQARRSRPSRFSAGDTEESDTAWLDDSVRTGGVGRLGADPKPFPSSRHEPVPDTTASGDWRRTRLRASDSASSGSYPAESSGPWPAERPEDETPSGWHGGDRPAGNGSSGTRLDPATVRWLDALSGRRTSTTAEPAAEPAEASEPVREQSDAVADLAGERQDTEPDLEPPIPFRRPSRNRSNAHGRSHERLALGDLLSEAMMAFHNGTHPMEERTSPDTDHPQRDNDRLAAVADIGWPSSTPNEMDTNRADERGDIGAKPSGNGFSEYPATDSYGRFGVDDDPGANSGGAHAGGRRPGLEWRLSDRPYFGG
ncbi:MAG: hypothetical protein ACRDQ5_23475 [Sciscionella sp.]